MGSYSVSIVDAIIKPSSPLSIVATPSIIQVDELNSVTFEKVKKQKSICKNNTVRKFIAPMQANKRKMIANIFFMI